MSLHSEPIICEQVFSRKSLGYLWKKRDELDPGQASILDALYKNRKRGTIEGSVRVEYHLPKTGAGKLGYGRMYGTKGSLETLERECRGTLCDDNYYDIDVKNCHPVLAVQFAKRYYNQELPEVQEYCDNRDRYLKLVSENRDEAKQAILKIFYNGRNDFAFLKKFQQEVKNFTQIVMAVTQYTDLLRYCKSQKENTPGMFLSFLLQTEERKVMLAMRKSLISRGWSVDVLAYDGVMIRKDAKLKFSQELLREVEEDVEKETGYKVELTHKEFEKFEVPEEEDEIAPKVSKTDYDQRKAQFEDNHFYFVPTNSIARIGEHGRLDFFDLQHAKTLFIEYDFKHSNLLKDKTSFLDLWLSDPTRRQIERIDQKPSENPCVYSPPVVFEYTKYEGYNEEAIDMFNRLLNINSGNNPELFAYLFKWIAHIVQKPFENPRTAIILTGEKGCGKDTLGDFIKEWVLGELYTHNYTSTAQFWDKHDESRLSKFFIKLEEASGALNRQHIGEMKARITSCDLTINPKCAKPITSKNYNRFLMTSNEARPVKVEDNERRFVVMACSPEWVGKHDEWTKLRKVLFTKEGASTIGQALLKVDLSDFNPSVLPVNEYMNEIIDTEKTPEQRFLENWNGQPKLSSELYTLYKHYCIENDLPYVKSSQSLGFKLTLFVRDGKLLCKHTMKGKVYYKPGCEETTEESNP